MDDFHYPRAKPAPVDPRDEPGEEAAERVRQGQILLRHRSERFIFIAGLAAPLIFLVVLWIFRGL